MNDSTFTKWCRVACWIIVYSLCLFASLFFLFWCALCALFPCPFRYQNRVYFFFTYFWNRAIMFFLGMKVKIKGVCPSAPFILVANHCSALDIVCLEYLLSTTPHLWIIKEEFKSIPLFGWLLKRMHLLVKRESTIQAARTAFDAVRLQKATGTSLVLFPEGTRTPSENPGLKKGYLFFAEKTGLPIVPVHIRGTEDLLAKGSWFPRTWGSHIQLVVGEKFLYTTSRSQEVQELVEKWFSQRT